ncbi:MAG: metal ABC transporter permease [Victivallales bacterium]|nr:metal ABC transporter permease [Victivallales bacterium]
MSASFGEHTRTAASFVVDFLCKNFYLHEGFVQNALLVGVLISLCASLLGVTLVLKRFSLIGDGLSHVAFGAMAIAGVLHFTHDMYFILPATILCAILMLRAGQNTAIMGDAAVAILSVASLAIGYLLVNLFSSSTNLTGDVCTTLFGSTSILTLKPFDVYLSIGLSLFVIAIFVLFYNKIFACTFDEDFARATGTPVTIYNFFIAAVIAVIIVLAMKLVGALLISALIIFPALSAMRVFRSFLAVTICAAVLSVLCSLSGMLISIVAGTPVGSTIVCCDLAAFILFTICGLVQRRFRVNLPAAATACLAVVLLASGCSCSKSEPAKPAATTTETDGRKIDLDLTQESATMAWTHAYYMDQNPDDYAGLRVRIAGRFGYVKNPENNQDIAACIVTDSTACCQMHFEFVPGASAIPSEGTKIVLTGDLTSVTRGATKVCHLENASFTLAQ